MFNVNLNSELKFIQKQFLCSVPVPNIEWLNLFDKFDWDDQERLVICTVNSDLVLQYPIKISYQQTFLKFIISGLEEHRIEVHDSVYEAFGRVVALAEPTACFKHYLLEEDQVITLKENPNIISEGTTGLCSWQASLALSEWCLTHKDLFSDKTILELGSGIGLTGLTVAKACKPKKIYLTDCHRSVLQVLCANVKHNIGSFKNQLLFDTSEATSNTAIEVLNLPWEDITEATSSAINPDLLLAADVIYDSSLFPSLVTAISYLLGQRNTKELIIACTERNKNTLEEFLNRLASFHIVIYRLWLN